MISLYIYDIYIRYIYMYGYPGMVLSQLQYVHYDYRVFNAKGWSPQCVNRMHRMQQPRR